MSALKCPLWIFTGPEFGERADAVDELRKKCEKESGQLDTHSLYASDIKIADVLSLLQNGSLFADIRFVVLRNAELIKKKEDIEMIAAWIKEKNDSFLILISDEISIDKKLETLVPKEQKRIFWEMFEDKKEQWLRSFFKKMQLHISDEAIQSILELVENNTQALKTECAHFALFFDNDHLISADDVEHILAHNREESAFTLFDRLCDADLESSLEVLAKIRLSKESSSAALIAGLVYCYRRLLVWHTLHENAYPSDFDLKIKGFGSPKAKDQYRRAMRLWNIAETERILALLARTDMEIRSTGSALEDIRLTTALYSIIRRKGRNLLAYTVEE